MVYYKLPSVMTADELMDFAYHRASKARRPPGVKSKLTSERAFAIAKLQSVSDSLGEKLKNYVENYPSIDRLHPFYRELTDIVVGTDNLKKSLGALNWARRKIIGVCSTSIRKIKGLSDLDEIQKARGAAYGRVSSVLKQISEDLLFINTCKEALEGLPHIEVDLPTVVIAGSPNVGKSMLVEKLSSARPEIAAYPFTTKQVSVGHFEHRWRKYQVIDTPGLLDSDPKEKKKIERQAVMALEHLADIIVFVLDPSEYCGYPLEIQLSLMDRLKKAFPDLVMIVVENKSDIKTAESDRIKISAMTEMGIDELKTLILEEFEKIPSDNKPPEKI